MPQTNEDETMKAICTLTKSTMMRGGFLANDSNMELFATCAKIAKSEHDADKGMYRICFTRGLLQGKTAYANDFEELNVKCSQVAIDFFN